MGGKMQRLHFEPQAATIHVYTIFYELYYRMLFCFYTV